MAFVQTQASLFNNPTFSDIKIKQIYNGEVKEYHAHKAVLCSQSGWFTKALMGSFKEASEGTIELHDDEPVYAKRMLKFFYTMEADSHAIDEKMAFLDPIYLYTLADKYQAENLKKWAVTHLKDLMSTNRNQFGCNDLLDILDAHYSQCVTIKDSLSSCLAAWFRNQMYHQSTIGSDDFLKLVRKNPILGADLFFATL